MVKILITDSVPLNTGDAAILQGMLALLARVAPDAELRLHAKQYQAVARRYPDLPLRRSIGEASREFPPRFFWRIAAAKRYLLASGYQCSLTRILSAPLTSRQEREVLSDYIWADAIISSGGSFLTDAYALEHVLVGYELGIALRKPMILLGQSLGPFANEENLKRVGRCLARFDLVAVRDEHSLGTGRQMGISDAQLALSADMAFSLAPEVEKKARREREHLHIGVSVRKWLYPNSSDPGASHASYVSRLAYALDTLIEQTGAFVTFISTCQGEEQYSYHDDEVADQVRGIMQYSSRAAVDHNFHKPIEFARKISDVDILVGTRMHSCILALLMGTPAVNLEYEFKSRELYRWLGCEEFVLDAARFNPAELAQKTRELIQRREALKVNIADKIAQFRELNFAVADRLREILSKP